MDGAYRLELSQARSREFLRRAAGLGGEVREWIAKRPVWASICVAYTALRLIPATTHLAGVTPDSALFLRGMTETSRPPFVPFVYALLREDNRRIAIVQGLVGAVCWLVLADVASHWVRTVWAKRALVVSVLVIGLCDIVDRRHPRNRPPRDHRCRRTPPRPGHERRSPPRSAPSARSRPVEVTP